MTFPFPNFAPSLMTEAAYTATTGTGNKLSTFTFSGLNIGTPRQDRHIVALLESANDTSGIVPVDTLTVGGISLTKHIEVWPNPDNNRGYAIFSGIVPTGTTATVTASASSSKAGCWLLLFDTTVNNILPYATYQDINKTGNSSVTIDAIGGSLIFAVSPSLVTSWTGLTNTYSNTGVSGGFIANSPQNKALNISTNNTDYLLVASWN
jgi:hypothetical protein